MKSQKRYVGLMITLVFVLLVMVACGGNNGANNKVDTPAPVQTPVVESPAKPVAETPSVEAEWDKVVEAAKAEGTLTLMTHPGVLEQQWVAEFQKAFPDIKVEHTGARPSDAAPKIIAEQQSKQYLWDVMVAATSNMTTVMAPAGAFEEIEPIITSLPNAEDDKWHGGVGFYAQNVTDKKYTFIHAMELYSTMYINKEVKGAEDFKGVEDLINPAFKGKIVVNDPSVPAFGSLSLTGVLNTQGEDFLRKLYTEQDAKFVDIVLSTNWLADGRYLVAVGADKARFKELKAAGLCTKCEPIIYEGMPTLSRGVSVLKNNPHPNATKVFINWLMSQEGGEVYSEAIVMNSRRVDVEPNNPNPLDWNDLDSYVLNGTETAGPILEKVMGIYKEIYH